MMKVYTNKTFNGHYPVGSAAVVIARNQRQAAGKLSEALAEIGLQQAVNVADMVELSTDQEAVRILLNGDY